MYKSSICISNHLIIVLAPCHVSQLFFLIFFALPSRFLEPVVTKTNLQDVGVFNRGMFLTYTNNVEKAFVTHCIKINHINKELK